MCVIGVERDCLKQYAVIAMIVLRSAPCDNYFKVNEVDMIISSIAYLHLNIFPFRLAYYRKITLNEDIKK